MRNAPPATVIQGEITVWFEGIGKDNQVGEVYNSIIPIPDPRESIYSVRRVYIGYMYPLSASNNMCLAQGSDNLKHSKVAKFKIHHYQCSQHVGMKLRNKGLNSD